MVRKTSLKLIVIMAICSLVMVYLPVNAATYTGYVMSYFGGDPYNEGLHLAYSTNGLNWTALYNNNSVLNATIGTKSVRDPYIYRKPDGKFVVMSTQGWDTNSIYMWDSNDLCTFTNERLVQVNNFSNRAWAPECIFDAANNRSVIFWSGNPSGSYNRIYCTTTTDFISFSTPQVLFDPGYDVIDGDITFYNGKYYLFFKDERGDNSSGTPYKALKIATSTAMTPGSFTILTPNYITDHLVEGPACIKDLTQNKWYLYYDYFMQNGIWGCSISTDLNNANGWTKLNASQFSLPKGARHGNAVPVTQAELDAIKAKWANINTFSDNFEDGNANGWTAYDGTWTVSNNNGTSSFEYQVNSGAGYKSVATGTNFANFVLDMDLFLGAGGSNPNAGVIFRVTNPGAGVDAYTGYYAGLNLAGYVVLGKASNNWTQVAQTNMTVTANTWYHMKVIAYGANIKVFVGDMVTPKINVNDTSYTAGAVGFRTYNTAARFDNISVTPGVIFYQDSNYGGVSVMLGKGNYTLAQLNALGVPNDWVSSLKVPGGWTVIMYQSDNFAGTSWTFTADTSYVGSACNDQMTSCKIQ